MWVLSPKNISDPGKKKKMEYTHYHIVVSWLPPSSTNVYQCECHWNHYNNLLLSIAGTVVEIFLPTSSSSRPHNDSSMMVLSPFPPPSAVIHNCIALVFLTGAVGVGPLPNCILPHTCRCKSHCLQHCRCHRHRCMSPPIMLLLLSFIDHTNTIAPTILILFLSLASLANFRLSCPPTLPVWTHRGIHNKHFFHELKVPEASDLRSWLLGKGGWPWW